MGYIDVKYDSMKYMLNILDIKYNDIKYNKI